jgi:DNA repair photolyase
MIVSVSRRTDIPAFYSEWFFRRLKEGFVYVRNPINIKQISKISLLPKDVDCFVFWSKNPESFQNHLEELTLFKYYFQFSINSYDTDLEPFVPRKKEVIKTFINLSKKIGKEKVIWRYDPILLTKKYTIEYHIKYFESIAKLISPFTEKCVISFVDIYKKCEINLKKTDVRELSVNEITDITRRLKLISDCYNLRIETCAEDINLDSLGVVHGKCIDNILIERILGKRVKIAKDKNQRKSCGCVESVDIGAYNTCKHGCLYCYANVNSKIVYENFKAHSLKSPLLFGEICEKDEIKERESKSIIESSLF